MNRRYMAVFMVICLMSFTPSSASAQDATKSQAPAWFKQADQNGDGKLSLDEAPNKEVFGDVDTDQDGFASLSEVNEWLSTRRPRGQSFNPVFGRHRYKIESAANLLKGEATRSLLEVNSHPMEQYRNERGRLPSMWGENQWVVYLDSEEAISNAIRYVEDNSVREALKPQKWLFVTPFSGIPVGGWTIYH